MSLGDTAERPDARPKSAAQRVAQSQVVRFAGDSGDGVQLLGGQFAVAASAKGADLMTLPEFPAEIRAPTGTTFGVSAYQVQFGPGEVLTPGDEADMLVAFNPAAFVTNISFLKPGGTVVIDEGAFNERGFAKAGLDEDPVDRGEGAPYRLISAEITKRTLEAVAEHGLGRKEAARAKNFWALGLSLWLCGQSSEETLQWVADRFSKNPSLAGANAAALKAGYAYGETMELALPEVIRITRAPRRSGSARMTSGTDAMALGVAAAGALSGKSVFYCSYPITPASALLHSLAKLKTGVRTFQAEDEIAAVCAAIGASYAGQLGVSASAGPGLSLKTEALGLAITAELPLIVIDVQRAGPSTGMPTKPEQADLDMAIFGRHGESPLAVLAPATPSDCFSIMLDAARIAIEATTPVIVLSDAFLANAVSDWPMPEIDALPDLRPKAKGNGGEPITAFTRDPETLARQWIAPGTPGLAHRVGGLEKDSVTGNISYDPDNHEHMVRLRGEKIARIAERSEHATLQEGPDEGDLLVIGWGSTYGPILQAARNLMRTGKKVTHLHLRQLWPLPAGLEEKLRSFKRVVCPEMNTGQLTGILRSTFLAPVEAVTQINGRPFQVSMLEAEFSARLTGQKR
ncbi:MAG: 2-oxoacid:acceptor oxidoreductase subunit alpha [Propylenella sp.]